MQRALHLTPNPRIDSPPDRTIGVKRLHGLDALRGVAALVVLLFHLNVVGVPHFISGGYLAVNLFFALSGYVMARTYEPGLVDRPLEFYRTRLAKLWPLMMLGTAIGLILMLALRPGEFEPVMLIEFALLPSFAAIFAYSLNPPAWSIFQELVGNFLHGLIFGRLQTASLLIISIGAMLFLIASQATIGRANLGPDTEGFGYGLFGMLASYLQGIIIWRLWADRPPRLLPPWLALLILPAWAALAPHFLDVLFIGLVCPLLLFSCIQAEKVPPILKFAGAFSFPLYAVHYPLLLTFGPAFGFVSALLLASAIALVEAEMSKRRKAPAQAT